MSFLNPCRTPLALLISAVLMTPGVAFADPAPCDAGQDSCDETSRAWLWGGLAALGVGVAAAAGGGGGGGSSSGPDPGNGGGGTPPPPVQPGDTVGNGRVLVAAGSEAHWNAPGATRVIGTARNDGRLQLQAGTLLVSGEGELHNHGTLDIAAPAILQLEGDADLENRGTLHARGAVSLLAEASLDNHGTALFDGATVRLSGQSSIDNHGRMTVTGGSWVLDGNADLDNARGAELSFEGVGVALGQRAEVENDGLISARGLASGQVLFDATSGATGAGQDIIEVLDNRGQIRMNGDNGVLRLRAEQQAARGVNQRGGDISSNGRNVALLHAEGARASLHNFGTLTVTGDGAVAMRGERGAALFNAGTINLGTAGDAQGRGLVAMQSDGSANITNERTGVINIHTGDSFAFAMGGTSSGRVINNGVVNIHGAGSGENAPQGAVVTSYTVGSNADGSSGRLYLHDGGHLRDVQVDSGFSRGTDASQMLLDNVVIGAASGEQSIRSSNIVWTAHGHRDAEGNIDVQMNRRDYRELAAGTQQLIAGALEANYRNDALFHALEVSGQQQFQQALDQLSGRQVGQAALRATANGDALWSQFAAQPADSSRVTAFDGSAHASGVRGTGSAVQVAVPLGAQRTLQVMTALLNTDRAAAGSHDRDQSRFAGMGYAQQWGRLQLRHQLGHEQHRMESQRNLRWEGFSGTAHGQRRIERSVLSSTLSHVAGKGELQWTPRLKASLFDQREAAFSEFNAGSVGLNVAAGRLRGSSVELGSQLQRALATHWTLRADVAVIRPLAMHDDGRRAWLQGADSHAFALPGVTANGLDHRLALGADYRHRHLQMSAQLSSERLSGQSDAAAQLQLAYSFR